jgi:hypothetical protein
MDPQQSRPPEHSGGSAGVVLLAWLLVSVPLLWGVWQTIKKAAALFR